MLSLITIAIAALLLGTTRLNAKSRNLSKDSGSGTLVARVTYPPKVMKLRRSTNMHRSWADLNAQRVGQGHLAWRPLATKLSKLQHQHDNAVKAARFWLAKYDRFVGVGKEVRQLRKRAESYARHAGNSLTWKSLAPTLKKRLHQLKKASHIAGLELLRWGQSLPHPTPSQAHTLICALPWSCHWGTAVGTCESHLHYYSVNGQYEGIFQMGRWARAVTHLRNGFHGGLNILKAYKLWLMNGRSFRGQWSCASIVGAP